MQISAITSLLLFAQRSSWVGILILILVAVVIWFGIRMLGDAFVWIRDECFDEFADLRKESEEKRKHAAKQRRENAKAGLPEPEEADKPKSENPAETHQLEIPAEEPEDETS